MLFLEIDQHYQVGVAQQNFGATALGEMPIFIPSLYEQNVFIQIVQLVDKQKFHSVLKNIIKVKESEVYA